MEDSEKSQEHRTCFLQFLHCSTYPSPTLIFLEGGALLVRSLPASKMAFLRLEGL